MSSYQILIVDDNPRIHDDFRKILAPRHATELDALAADLFDDAPIEAIGTQFELHHAYQGIEAVDLVRTGPPFAVAFIDMRMPPGMDGLETIERLWHFDPDLQVVICSAYSDHSWSALRDRLGEQNGLLILRKPFDPIEALQCTHALAGKWHASRELRSRIEQLETMNARLAELLVQRDRTEDHLRKTSKLAKMGELAAGIAHEIASPITYVGANLEAVDELWSGRKSDPEIPGALASMRHGVERIATIVRAMRELSHPGFSEPRPADLNQAMRSALELSVGAYSSSTLESELGDLPPVVCHVGELQQVFLNLIVNAGQAMRNRGGTLHVRSAVDGTDVVVSVGDTGGGIPEHIRERIFDPFFTTKDIGEGTGQGLAISRTIVARHAGSLTYETELDRGTTFHVRIPIAGPAQSQAA